MRALVTGAAGGICRAVASRLDRDHQTLILMDINSDAANELTPLAKVEIVVGSVAPEQGLPARQRMACTYDAGSDYRAARVGYAVTREPASRAVALRLNVRHSNSMFSMALFCT